MKKVRIKSKKPLPFRIPRIFAIAFLLLALSLAIYFMITPKAKPVPLPPNEPDSRVLLFQAEESELISFTIQPSDGNAYTLLHENGIYSIQDYPDYKLDHRIIDEMIEALLYLEAEEFFFDTQDDDLNDYGLEKSALQVSAQFLNNRSYSFKIGHRAPSDIPKDYGIFAGNSGIYGFSITLKDVFDQKMNWLHVLPDINFSPDLLEGIKIIGNKSSLILQRQAKDVWILEEPFLYPVNEMKIIKVLDSVNKMRFASFVEPVDKANLDSYGLDKPRFKITFLLAPSIITSISSKDGHKTTHPVAAQEIHIKIGDSIDGIGFYCQYLDNIYQASDLSMGFMLETNASSYLSSTPMNVPLDLIDSVTIIAMNGIKNHYTISLVEHILPNNQIGVDSQGNILYDYVIASDNSMTVSTENFVKMYGSLMSISSSGTLNGFSRPVDQAIMKIELNYMNSKRIIIFYPYDALHMAMEVDGSIISYTELENLKKIDNQLSRLYD